jgi:DNA-binding transcriptional MerR regulator
MRTIGKIAKLLGVSTDTIRHYKNLQLLHPYTSPNGYLKYDSRDALITLLTKELSSMDMPLADIKCTIEDNSINQFNDWLDVRHVELEMELKRIQDELTRLQEIKKYTGYGIELLDCIDEFNGADIYSLPIFGSENVNEKFELVKEWVNFFPFSYISVNLPQNELNDDSFDQNYTTSVGIGVVKKYAEEFSLTTNRFVNRTEGGLCLRTCIVVEDLFSISPQDLSKLRCYTKAKGYKFSNNSSGRLLFIKNADKKPLYYVLIWVRVEYL